VHKSEGISGLHSDPGLGQSSRSRLLEVENVSAGYGPVNALHQLSLHASSGEVVSVLGANGAGKTTLLRAISGFLPLSAGEIRLNGTSLNGLSASDISRLGVIQVVETRGVLPSLTVEENLLLAALGRQRVPRHTRRRKLDEVCELFPWLGARLQSYGGELSGGQQQMVALGRAVVADPILLLLDEPSLGVAPTLVDEIYEQLERIVQDGSRTIILVEQEVDRALRLSTRGYVLQRGAVALTDTAEALASGSQIAEVYFS